MRSGFSRGAVLLATVTLTACTSGEPVSGTKESGWTVLAPGSSQENPPTPAPYEPGLQWMLDKTAYAEDPDRPCLMRQPPRSSWVDDPQAGTRLREVRSDSYWLGRWARDNLGDRLAYANVTYDWKPMRGEPPPSSPPPLIYEIAVTGEGRINPPPLHDRARGVPVKVVYGVPVSDAEFMRRRDIGRPIAQQLVDMVSEGGSPESGWAVRLSVFSEDGESTPEALAQCDALRRAYRLPVLMEFSAGRISPL
ncbi:hypothetical protein [Sphingomonas melonis]|uniref:hypothetical protein n=1 Tax=Sphingomonas melonis TaxID=152682 RepID=UPI0035C7DFA5